MTKQYEIKPSPSQPNKIVIMLGLVISRHIEITNPNTNRIKRLASLSLLR